MYRKRIEYNKELLLDRKSIYFNNHAVIEFVDYFRDY